MSDPAQNRLEQLRGFLREDPLNPELLSEAAETAFSMGDLRTAREILDVAPDVGEHMRLNNVWGLIELASGDFKAAQPYLEAIAEAHPDSTDARFNLAYARAGVGQHEAALELLNADTITALPQAATLKLQLLHAQGDLEAAQAYVVETAPIAGNDPRFTASAAMLAMDRSEAADAKALALKSADQAESQVVLGVLAMREGQVDDALVQFGRATKNSPDLARGHIGVGLVAFNQGDLASAIQSLSKGAALFKTHIGSWIALGWAQVMNDDVDGAERSFQVAYDIDANFGETHGALGVIALLRGDMEAADRSLTKGRRLDPQSFGVALGYYLKATSMGQTDRARAIFETAMNTTIDGANETMLNAMTKLGFGQNDRDPGASRPS